MNYNDTPEEAVFRQEVKNFLAAELPKEKTDHPADGFPRPSKGWTKKLADRKWIAPAWPKEYGGAGLHRDGAVHLQQGDGRVRALPASGGIATGFAGPTLIVHGTEEQKKKYLPGILTGEAIWCQGYSEPGSGSDLASLQTRAVRDGDDYVVNGQKIWTSGGARSPTG